MYDLKEITVSLADLLLDPNNYRYESPGERRPKISDLRIKEDSTQHRALQRIKDDGVTDLMNSIRTNGFIKVDSIIVRPLEATGKYVVIEGNRRTASLKLLQEDYLSGVDADPDLIKIFENVPVLVTQASNHSDYLALMGIRHVGGVKEWGGYQSAFLVHELRTESDFQPRDIAERLGLPISEVNRRLRAFGALSQMSTHEEFGDYVTPGLYPIFHEAVSIPALRLWLGWTEPQYTFQNDENRDQFYTWISGDEPKLKSYKDVRQLKSILSNQDALSILLDEERTLADALAIIRQEAQSTQWKTNVKATLKSLNNMGRATITTLTREDIQLLKELIEAADYISERGNECISA